MKVSVSPYKMLALDLDGVTRTSTGGIRKSLLRLLDTIRKRGVHVTVVTGKSLRGSQHLIEALGIRDLIVCNHGAIIADPVKKKLLFEKRLPRYALNCIVPMLRMYPELQCYFTADNQLIMIENPAIPPSLRYHEKIGIPPSKIYSLATDFRKYALGLPSKIIFYTPIGKEKKYMRVLKRRFKEKIHVYRTKPGNVELSPVTASKGKALLLLAKNLGVQPKEIMAIGDEENDVSMLHAVGLGIAMKNAVPSVKRAAHYITTKTNDEGGVEEVIEKFILKKPH